MERKTKYTLINTLFESILSGIILWIIKDGLNSVWKSLKRRRSQKKRSLLLRLADADIRLLAMVLGVHPAEIKFSMNRAKKFGIIKGGFKSLFEVYMYAFKSVS